MKELIDLTLEQKNYDPLNLISGGGLKREERDKANQILFDMKMRGGKIDLLI